MRPDIELLFHYKHTHRRREGRRSELVVYRLTDSQLLQVTSKLRFLLQHFQQVSGLHPLQLHLPVDVDFVTEADVHQAGAVLTLLTCVLTCKHTKTLQLHQCADFGAAIISCLVNMRPCARVHTDRN